MALSFYQAHQKPRVGFGTMWNYKLFLFHENREIHHYIYLASSILGKDNFSYTW